MNSGLPRNGRGQLFWNYILDPKTQHESGQIHKLDSHIHCGHLIGNSRIFCGSPIDQKAARGVLHTDLGILIDGVGSRCIKAVVFLIGTVSVHINEIGINHGLFSRSARPLIHQGYSKIHIGPTYIFVCRKEDLGLEVICIGFILVQNLNLTIHQFFNGNQSV